MRFSTIFYLVISLGASGLARADEVVDKVIPHAMERAQLQYRFLLGQLTDANKMPRTLTKSGDLREVKFEDWTSGFFPGSLWLLYEYSGDDEWRKVAHTFTDRLEKIRHFKGNHDGGFMLGCSFGNALRLDPQPEHQAVLNDAAAALATRYQPSLGMIRSWDHGSYSCPVIIDNMMNLELLSWSARNGGAEKLKEIAISHADKTNEYHFRADGSAYHVVDYDVKTGWVRAFHATQGADARTPWARGQSWGLYGFTMMFRQEGKNEYLRRAVSIADFLIEHPNMPSDFVPNWDYGLEPGEAVPRDASAAAVMASALVELSGLVEDQATAKKYQRVAAQQIRSLASDQYLAAPESNKGFILTRSTGHLPGGIEINVPLNYADYYFLEAMLRYQAMVKGDKRNHFGTSNL